MQKTEEMSNYALERRRAYQREYRKNHPEKVMQWRKNAAIAAYRRMIERGEVDPLE